MIRPAGRAPRAGFRVGDRVHHKEFGEGLIVEVRERDGFEVLEIAFPDGIRRLRGRALLADEVGLGKTIEAGIILKEYLLRGLVQRALILVPASLVEQWDQELRRKFDLEFAVLKHGTAWWEEPLLLASMDT